MKKLIVLCLIVALLLSGCELDKNVHTLKKDGYRLITLEPNGIIYVEGYYKLAPYYSPNGKLCHYVDGVIVEVD